MKKFSVLEKNLLAKLANVSLTADGKFINEELMKNRMKKRIK